MFYTRIFDKLKDTALESNHSWAKVSACVVSRGQIVGIGTNKNKTHPFQAKFAKNKEAIFLHAEINAIRDAMRVLSLEGLQNSCLYICRMKQDKGKYVFGLAKPCEGCFRAIVTFNIPKVYFTTDAGIVERL